MAKISGGKAGFSSGVVKAGSILISLAGITVEELVGEQLEMDNDSVPLVAVKEVRLVVVVPKEKKNEIS